MATFNVRRIYLHKRIAARSEESSLEPVWQAKQEAEAGTALPAAFPFLSQLSAVGYSTQEDLEGADAEELAATVGLGAKASAAVLAALADL